MGALAMPAVSVVLPTYNAERFLASALESLRCQEWQDFEVLVVDGGSTDRTHEIVRGLAASDDRFRLVTAGRESLVDSLNRGCRMARGRFVARMDADDLADPRRLSMQVAFLEEHPEIGVVGSWVQIIDEAGRKKVLWVLPEKPDETSWHLVFDNALAHASVMVRSELMAGDPYRASARHCEDYDLWCRLEPKAKLANLPHALLLRREWPENVSALHGKEMNERAGEIARQRMQALLGGPVDAAVVGVLRDGVRGLRIHSARDAWEALRLLGRLEQAFMARLGPGRARRRVQGGVAARYAAFAVASWRASPRLALMATMKAVRRAPVRLARDTVRVLPMHAYILLRGRRD